MGDAHGQHAKRGHLFLLDLTRLRRSEGIGALGHSLFQPGTRFNQLGIQRLKLLSSRGIDVDLPGLEWRNLDDKHDLAVAYGEAWVAALPSVSEAFGLVLVEAMACGTPVVGYRDGGIPELIGHSQTGRLFDRLEPQALAQALLETLELARAPQTAAACRAQAEEYSTDRCTEQYLALYAELGAG